MTRNCRSVYRFIDARFCLLEVLDEFNPYRSARTASPFPHWRATRKYKREPIPEELRSAAVEIIRLSCHRTPDFFVLSTSYKSWPDHKSDTVSVLAILPIDLSQLPSLTVPLGITQIGRTQSSSFIDAPFMH
jgi:hypothetical protein